MDRIDCSDRSSACRSPEWLLLEDGPLIAVNKPAGLLTEGSSEGDPTMVEAVKQWLRVKYQKPGNVYLGLPHRLDRATSGVLVFTRNSKTAARVAEQFAKRQVTKKYRALLERSPESNSGVLVDWLVKRPEAARSEVVSPQHQGGREARLEYRVLDRIDGRPLVEVDLLTGRMHQIRVQFSSRGCPVVGDTKYGADEWPVGSDVCADDRSGDSGRGGGGEWRRMPQIALHAYSLSLLHPIRYTPITIDAPVPASWKLRGNADLKR